MIIIVISVNEVPDGSADSMIADLSQKFQKLREVAHALRLPNADKINPLLIQPPLKRNLTGF